MEKMLISGVAKDDHVARLSVIGVPDKPGYAFKLFSKLSNKNVNVDIILQSIGRNGTKDISFTIAEDNLNVAVDVIKDYVSAVGASDFTYDTNVSKVSIVGAGMESHPGVASQMFEAMYDCNVNIRMISTSEIKISLLIDRADSDKAVRSIHDKFFGE